MNNYLFKDIVIGDEGLLKGPFGSDLKKELYVPKGVNTYKVYLQDNILKENNSVGDHYISQKYYEEKMSRYKVKENDFIVTCDGTLGEIFQLKHITEKGIISSSLLRITLNNKIVDDDYFYYLFKALIKKQLITQGNNSVLKHLPGLGVIRNHPICLPDLCVQKVIGKILRQIDDKIKNNKKQIETLESLAKTFYDYWFVQFDFPNEDGKPYKSSGGKMVWNEELKREIPEGWDVSILSELCIFKNGINYDKNQDGDDFRIINVRNISSSSLILNEDELDVIKLNKEAAKKYLLKNIDILIARSGIPGAVRLLLNPSDNVVYCGFSICCTPKDESYRHYITYYLKQFEGSAATKTGGSILENVSQNTLGMLKVFIPQQTQIKLFNERISPILSLIERIIRENNHLKQIKEFLLPLLMNGQVQIKE